MKKISIFFLILLGFASCKNPVEERPNFVIIICDDISWNDVGAYGHPKVQTPNADRLAEEGMRFTNAFLTTSSCSPSRCSIMTGRYPHSTGAPELHQPLPDDQIVFAGLLKDAGYYTASAGKWHLGEAAKKNFDVVLGGGPSGCEKWVETIQNRPKDKPFFFWLASFDAHRDYEENIIENPHKLSDAVIPPFLPDNESTREDLDLYYDEIARLDQYTGEVLAELQKQGVAENTLIIYMSDNGRPFPRCKTTLYDSGIQTPFIVKWPTVIHAGKDCDELVSAIDIAPTFLELAGVEIGDSFQGKSFARMLLDPSKKTNDFVFGEHNWHDFQAHERSVRSKDFLYIWNAFPALTASPPADAVRSITYQKMIELEKEGELNADQLGCFIQPRPQEELYDVNADPFSLKNLADDPNYAEKLAEMRNVLDSWKVRTNDTVPENPTPDKFDRITGERIDQ